MKGQTFKGMVGFIGLTMLAGAASCAGSHLCSKGIEKIQSLKERSTCKSKSNKNTKVGIIQFQR